MKNFYLKNKTLSVLLIFLNLIVSAQSKVQGNIKSSITNDYIISSVYVDLFDINKKYIDTYIVLNDVGFFEFKNLEENSKHFLKFSAFGYTHKEIEINTTTDSINLEVTLTTICNYNDIVAENDWKSNNPKLFLFGSISPIANTKNDIKFEKKYKIQYYDFGCTPEVQECIKLYNEQIFIFLDKKYGTKWRNEVRKDVLFLY